MFKKIISEHYIAIIRIAEIITIALLIPLLYNFVPIDKNASESFYIDATNVDTVVSSLELNGYTVTIIDKIMMQSDQIPESGWYTLDKKVYGRFYFYQNIYKHKASTMKIVVYAGETHNELIKRLANDLKLDRGKLYETYKSLSHFKEGDIFAGQYIVARKADEKSVILYLFSQSKKIFDILIEKTFASKPEHSVLKVLLTIASIIQKESNSKEEMPIISGVIFNRLNKNMKLQMDSTLNYGKFSHTIVTPERIKTDISYYNTYKHKGLPPHPLGTVSIDALRSAMFPDKNKYIFFMLKPDGGHKFCETYKEHLTNIRTFRAYQKKRDEEKKKEEKALMEAQKKRKDSNESNHSNKPSQKKL